MKESIILMNKIHPIAIVGMAISLYSAVKVMMLVMASATNRPK